MCTLNELSTNVAECAACLSAFPHVSDRSESLRMASELLLNVVGNLDLAHVRSSFK
ncbi:MAG: hypothetical protein LC776_17470 [Acidobacteria bacterium]|nr:hypothetical protein [Acidobacteriota bacterium]